jgi:hypothetical protein
MADEIVQVGGDSLAFELHRLAGEALAGRLQLVDQAPESTHLLARQPTEADAHHPDRPTEGVTADSGDEGRGHYASRSDGETDPPVGFGQHHQTRGHDHHEHGCLAPAAQIDEHGGGRGPDRQAKAGDSRPTGLGLEAGRGDHGGYGHLGRTTRARSSDQADQADGHGQDRRHLGPPGVVAI